MNLLLPIFKVAAKLPVKFPTEGYDAQLVACGAKPFACFGTPLPERIPLPGSLSKEQSRVFADIAMLEAAVSQGKLDKRSETFSAPGVPTIRHDYYFQPAAVQQVTAAIDKDRKEHRAWHGELTAEQQRAREEYLAYCNLPLPVRAFASAAAPLTRFARFQVAKHAAVNGTPAP